MSRIFFARSRTRKCAELGPGASLVHVRMWGYFNFFGVGRQINKKQPFCLEKGILQTRVVCQSARPHPLEVGMPTTLQDANRAAAVRFYSPPDILGWSVIKKSTHMHF